VSVPTSPKLRDTAAIVDKISNFGSFPPTQAYRDLWQGEGLLLNLHDVSMPTAAAYADQIIGIRSHGVWAGVWEPVPPSGDDGAGRAKIVHENIAAIDAELAKRGQTTAARAKIDVVGLNLEGYSPTQAVEFLWGRIGVDGITKIKGWRGSGGQRGSNTGYRYGMASYWIDEPFKDGSVKPHADLMLARIMLAVEGFTGDMTPVDHVAAILDRIEGCRWDGTIFPEEAYPIEQVLGCYDGALGRRGVRPKHGGLHFTLDRMREYGLV
jgi:hypothetical protein